MSLLKYNRIIRGNCYIGDLHNPKRVISPKKTVINRCGVLYVVQVVYNHLLYEVGRFNLNLDHDYSEVGNWLLNRITPTMNTFIRRAGKVFR